jgi:hypothetical protein
MRRVRSDQHVDTLRRDRIERFCIPDFRKSRRHVRIVADERHVATRFAQRMQKESRPGAKIDNRAARRTEIGDKIDRHRHASSMSEAGKRIS